MSEALGFRSAVGVSSLFPPAWETAFLSLSVCTKSWDTWDQKVVKAKPPWGFPPAIWPAWRPFSHFVISFFGGHGGSPSAGVSYGRLARNRCSANTLVYLYSELLGSSEGGILVP